MMTVSAPRAIEGKPHEIAFQEQASSHIKLRWQRVRVVSAQEKQ
jgi:hypothetical protein